MATNLENFKQKVILEEVLLTFRLKNYEFWTRGQKKYRVTVPILIYF